MSILSTTFKVTKTLANAKISFTPKRCASGSKIAFLPQFFSDQTFSIIIEDIYNGFQSFNLPFPITIFSVVLSIRAVTFPIYVFSEKLIAKRFRIQERIRQQIFEKVGNQYNIGIVEEHLSFPDDGITKRLNSNDKILIGAAQKMIEDRLTIQHDEEKLSKVRIMCLRLSTMPLWIFSSMALGRITDSFLWATSIHSSDPYYFIPITVGTLFFINSMNSRRAFDLINGRKFSFFIDIYNTFLVIFFTMACAQLPITSSFYWLIVMSTTFVQNNALRHPKVKSILGIGPLPTDTTTPIRNLIGELHFPIKEFYKKIRKNC